MSIPPPSPLIAPLVREHLGEAATLMGLVFGDDAYWQAIGGDRRLVRETSGRRLHAAIEREDLVFGAWMLPDSPLCGIVHAAPSEASHNSLIGEIREFALVSAAAGLGAAWRSREIDRIIHQAAPRQPHLYLHTLATHPDWQGQGIGRCLLNHIFDEAARDNRSIVLDTSEHNLGYYERLGFTRTTALQFPRDQRAWMLER
jgi:ribosomal protein S18 acetylase RimI-like enzyme